MATLTGNRVKDTYKDLLQVSSGNTGITTDLTAVSDGEGTGSKLELSTTAVNISSAGALQYAGTAITSTAAELNILDGATITVSELNILDGVTATAAEINLLDGVTATTSELNILDGVTSTASELNILDGVTSTTAELNILDGVTASATDINLIDGITNGTVIASKAIITDSNKDISGGRNITISGELDAATLDISGDVDVDGTLETDALTINGTTSVAFESADHSKLDGIEASADVTDTANVTSAGALMDSEVTNLAFVKSLAKGISDGNVLTANDAVADNDFLRIDGTEVEGLTVAEVLSALNVESGATADQSNAEIVAAVEAGSDSNTFTDADHSKLNAIEASADVTDATNVAAAGALMDSEVTDLDGIKSLTVPNSTTISTFGASLVDDASASAARTTLGVDASGTDNSTNVTLVTSSHDYLSLSGQAITLGTIDVSDDTNLTAGTNISLSGDTLNVDDAFLINSGNDTTSGTITAAGFTTTGTLAAGLADIDDVVINGTTIGHTDDTDLITLADGNVTIAGELDLTTLDVSGDADIDGTLEADAITVGGTALNTVIAGVTVSNATLASTVTITDKSDNVNYDLVFGNSTSALYDDTGALYYNPSTGLLTVPNLSVAGTTTQVDTVTMNAENAVVFEGATADGYETTLTVVDPTADRTINLPNVSGTLPVLAAASTTQISATPAELNVLDGITAVVGELNALDLGSTAVGTAIASKAVILDSNKDYTGLRNFTITGELDAATLDISGDADIDGTLEADAITVGGTALSSVISGTTVSNATTAAVATTVTITDNESTDEDNAVVFTAGGDVDGGNLGLESDGNLVYNPSTGRLTATQLAGTLQTAAQTNITSLGTLTALTVDNVAIDGAVIGHTGDTDLITLSSGVVTVAGELDATSLDISGNADIDGTLEADAITVDGTALATYIRDTVGSNMLSSNTESGITVTYDTSNDNIDFSVDAAQTGITSLLATDIKIGEDDQTKVDFEDANTINFYADNTKRVSIDSTGLNIASGSLETATIDYTDGDVAITIADGGGVTNNVSLTLASGATVTAILDEDDLSSDSATSLATQQSIKAYIDAQVAASGSGDITAVTFQTDTGSGSKASDTGGSADFSLLGGDGIGITNSGTTITAAVSAAQTTITSLLATDIKIGEDDQTKIDFETADTINFYAGNEKQLILTDGALTPGADNILDLGSSGVEFKDAYFDGTVTSDAFAGPLTGDVTGNVSGTAATVTGAAQTNITSLGTLTALTVDNVSINGSTIGHTGDTDLMTVASGVLTVAGEVDATSLDISGDADIDGTLETDALSINGTTVTSTAAELNILDGKSFVDEDDMSSDSATAIPSQQSVKAYVDAQDFSAMSFVMEDGDGTEVTITKNKEMKFVEGTGIDVNWTDTSNGSDGDPYDLTIALSHLGIESLSDPGGDKILIWDDSAGAVAWATANTNLAISGTNINATDTDTNTTYSAGTNISLSSTTFNVDDAFLINDGNDTTSGTITAAGFTTTGNLSLAGHAVNDIDVGSEFVDADDHLMTSGAIKEKIESYGYTTNTGDMTGVDLTGANGIAITSESNTGSGAYSATVNISHLGIEDLSDPNADRILIWDDSAGAVAWGTANTGLSISGTNINNTVSDTNTTYSAGTNISLSGTTFNVDDAFLKNDANDTTSGTITAGGFTTSGSITLGGHSFNDIDIGSEFVDTDDHLMSSGAIKEKIESYGYATQTGDITGVTAGTNLSGGGSSGSVTLNVDDAFLINSGNDTTSGTITAAGFTTSGSITLGGHSFDDIDIGSEFTDADDHLMSAGAIKEKIEDYGYTTNTGDITGVTAGVGLSGGGSSGGVTLTLDMSELTDMTASVNSSQDELIILDNGADRRKLISEIPLSAFDNDSGFTTTSGDITGVTAGTNCSGGGSSGSVTINVDDAFLINDGNDTTSGTITAAGFNTASGKVGDTDDEYIDFGTAGEIQFKIDDVEDFMMADGGTFHANADVIAYSSSISSDKRLKKNIKDVSYGLEDVLKLRGVEFDWKEKLDGKHDIGFIAQEIEEVVPELVKEVDGLNNEDPHLVVDYAKLVPVLVESIKELKEEIDLLSANLDQLKYNRR